MRYLATTVRSSATLVCRGRRFQRICSCPPVLGYLVHRSKCRRSSSSCSCSSPSYYSEQISVSSSTTWRSGSPVNTVVARKSCGCGIWPARHGVRFGRRQYGGIRLLHHPDDEKIGFQTTCRGRDRGHSVNRWPIDAPDHGLRGFYYGAKRAGCDL